MKKSSKLLVFICFLAFLLPGCGKAADQGPVYRFVTGVDISFQHEDSLLTRHYTENEKVESVLMYLRLLKPLAKLDGFSELSGEDIYRITVHLSDGVDQHYYQAQHRYLIRPDNSWSLIDPGQASELYRLMRHYSSDTQL